MRYTIDGEDRVSSVGPDWLAFAEANDAPDLVPDAVVGRPVWSFVSGPEVRELWRIILQHVRSGRPARFTVRCDAPLRRRVLDLQARLDGEDVAVTTALLQEEPRARPALLDPARPRGLDLLPICSWCQRAHLPHDVWIEIEEAVQVLGSFEAPSVPSLTHGLCPRCFTEAMARLGDDDVDPGTGATG